jgi:transposase InsO family protein
MPWTERCLMSLRSEFVSFADREGLPMRKLCRRFGISAKTGYKWLRRHQSGQGLADRSRRPLHSPTKTPEVVESAVLQVRQEHPTWGGRKIRRRLIDLGGTRDVPSAATVTAILHRHGQIDPEASAQRQPWIRFERAAPNDLWQMDFKGYFETDTARCFPLTVLDDHSRYCISLRACANQCAQTVTVQLIGAFRTYGLPRQMNMDNGTPWGCEGLHIFTRFAVWLMDLGIKVTHSHPYHPQTNGKDERFHRTLNNDLIQNHLFAGLEHCQKAFDPFRHMYNHQRPHEALGLDTPASHYRPSSHPYPEHIAPYEYEESDLLRSVITGGKIKLRHLPYRVGGAFVAKTVALRPTATDGIWHVFYRHQHIRTINERDRSSRRPSPPPEEEMGKQQHCLQQSRE